MEATAKKSVIIVGGGFAGLNAAKAFKGKNNFSVILIDRRNYHLFQPLLYQVATAGLSPAEISAPIRSIVSKLKNVSVYLGNVTDVNLKNKEVIVDEKVLTYDYLILACGAKHSYFGHQDWETNAPGLKTLEQATEIRRRILLAYEKAEIETNPEIQKQLMTFVIVGGGPTGVELAGAIAEISRHTLLSDFRKIDPAQTRVILIEAGQRVLASFDPGLARKAAADLEDLGVQIWTNSRVTGLNENSVSLGDEKIKASTVLWAAGVEPSSLNKKLDLPLDKGGRVLIEKDLSIKGHPEVFILGDQACYVTEDGTQLPGLASVALQQGTHAAKLIIGEDQAKPRKDFKYLDKGQMATIGRKKAIAQIGGLKVTGFFAWIIWLFIHVYFLIGFKNKVLVIWQWIYAYVTFKRGARLIVDKEWRQVPTGKP